MELALRLIALGCQIVGVALLLFAILQLRAVLRIRKAYIACLTSSRTPSLIEQVGWLQQIDAASTRANLRGMAAFVLLLTGVVLYQMVLLIL